MAKKHLTEEEFNEIKAAGTAHLETIREWSKTKKEEEQVIYAAGYDGNLVACALSGDTLNILSLTYDLMEEIAKKAGTDVLKLCMSFMAIYAEKCKRASKDKDDTEDKAEEPTSDRS